MSHRVSVVIPTFNRKDLLIDTVQSVLEQSVQPHEVIICDDGSTDGTEEYFTSHLDRRIKFVKCGRNGRPARPRNIGIAKASGDWIAFSDSDDLWEPTKLEKQLTAADRERVSFIASNAMRIDKAGSKLGLIVEPEFSGRMVFSSVFELNRIPCSTVLTRKSLLRQSGGFPEAVRFKAIEDYCLWLRILFLQDGFFLNENLVTYRDTPAESLRRDDISVLQQRRLIFKHVLFESTKRASFRKGHHRGQLFRCISEIIHASRMRL